MDDLLCPACGSNDLKDEVVERTYVPPFGAPVRYELTIQRCRRCDEGGDFVGANPAVIKEAIDTADRESARVILEYFGDAEISMAFIERALRLPKRTLARWKTGDISAAGIALLRIIRLYPWILGVAAMGFERTASKEALKVAVEELDITVDCSEGSSFVERISVDKVIELESCSTSRPMDDRSHAETLEPIAVAG